MPLLPVMLPRLGGDPGHGQGRFIHAAAIVRHREAAFPKGKLHLGGAGLQGVFHQVIDQALQQRPVPLYFPIGG